MERGKAPEEPGKQIWGIRADRNVCHVIPARFKVSRASLGFFFVLFESIFSHPFSVHLSLFVARPSGVEISNLVGATNLSSTPTADRQRPEDSLGQCQISISAFPTRVTQTGAPRALPPITHHLPRRLPQQQCNQQSISTSNTDYTHPQDRVNSSSTLFTNAFGTSAPTQTQTHLSTHLHVNQTREYD
ncbi:uncharacterized protein YALI1_C12834g [Yarrowia lipolytica]|uniref:Uncharacterized protein n=1 Tax=Yarrowia lipolytica TaxID=4952 RepID=A0A1D8NAB3_YARLL|nr:hypothetical protein YALI1_C12834g [Yarrowia lipolytica]